jgi:RimJ/RimL family protein N-acetyltransferase
VLLRLAFDQLGLAAVTATCDPENLASVRVMEKCGLRLEGEGVIETWAGRRPRLRFRLARPQ